MTHEVVTKARFRPWRDLRWITGGVVALFLGWLAWNLLGPEPAIVVSRETTFITEPLAADGLPDYTAAALARSGSAPKPEENAAAGLLQVCWPLGISAADLPAVCKAVGIPREPPAEPLRDPSDDAASGITRDMFGTSYEQPWTTAELPEVAAWLVTHEAAVDRLVEATGRPRYWLPSPTLLKPDPDMLISCLLPDIQEIRKVSRILGCRAMWHIGEGRPAAAWSDVRAVYRLSRLLAAPDNGPPFLVTQLVAIAIASTAASTARHLLATSDLPADLLAEIRGDLDSLAPLPAAADGMRLERLGGIDAIVWTARRLPGGRGARSRVLGGAVSGSFDYPLTVALVTSIDWNIVLRRMNLAYDALDAACSLPTRDARQAALDRQQQEHIDRTTTALRSWWKTAGHALLLVCNRGHRSEAVGDTFLAMLLPALSGWHDALARGLAQFELTRTAAALAAWRADRAAGDLRYPERLDDLVPRYVAAVPADPFSQKPFIYERRGDGYLLASVGVNGVYDGGDDFTGAIVGGEWQDVKRTVDHKSSDIVVRMPMPRKPVKP